MQNNLVIITVFTLCNFLIFLALIVIIIRAKNRYADSSFKRISGDKYKRSEKTAKASPESAVSKKEPAAVCCGKCDSHKSGSCNGLHEGDKAVQKKELVPID